MVSLGVPNVSRMQQLKEVALRGKLDLSMWRGGSGDEDDDDKDSSIELPLSPKSPSNNNNHIDNLAVQLPAAWATAERNRDNLLLLSRNEDGVNTISIGTDSSVNSANGVFKDTVQNNYQQSHLSRSHNPEKIVDNFRESEERNGGFPPHSPIEIVREQSKGGVKKVEFLENKLQNNMKPENHTSLLSTEKAKYAESINKATSNPKRTSRSPSGTLLNEIRKMSLASQDAEEEKKKLAATNVATVNPIKRSRRFRKRKREEEYTDKDRAAAVTLGSRDIKTSLKAKKKRERKMRLSIDLLSSEEYVSSMLVVEALYQMKVRKTPGTALVTLNKALELQPTHKGALVARSQCHLRLGDANSALKDAKTSFGQNETFIQGLYQYAEALYQLGEFEKSLIAFHQGYRLRKDMQGFRIGVQKSQEAIRRAIGDPSSTKMGNLDEILSIIEELQDSKRKSANSCKDEEILQNILKRRFGDKACSLPKIKSKSKNQWVTREVLGQMYLDKEYLAKFIHRSDVKNQIGNADALRETAREGLKYLESREKFWRQQNPKNSIYKNLNLLSQQLSRYKIHSE